MKNLLAALIFVVICVIGAVFVNVTNKPCEALAGYKWTIQFGLPNLILFLLQSFILVILGIFLFLIIRRICKSRLPEKYDLIKLIYFALLPLVVFYNQFSLIPQNLFCSGVKKSVCGKTSGDGMSTRSEHLNLEEYQYLQSELFLLPDLPKTSDSINISYYTDNFLGDFMLNVSFVCASHEQINTTNEHWDIAGSDSLTRKISVSFSDYAD